MPSLSCSPIADLLRLALAAAALAAAVAGRPLAAATVEQRTVDVEIRADGSAVERTREEVRLDSATDVDAWSSYPIFLDDNRQLDSCSAWVRLADGRTVKVGREGFDTVESLGGAMILHSSQKVRVVHFPAAVPGAVLSVEHQVTVHPYFPGGRVVLGGGDAIARLHVRVHGAGPGWRWRIAGQSAGLAVAEAAGEVTVTGAGLPPAPVLVDAPDRTRRGPVLLYAWGEAASWAGVGSWYDGVARGLAHGSDEVRRQARELIAAGSGGGGGVAVEATPGSGGGGAEMRRRLASLLAFLRRDVRYVAVEVGIGGYRPAPPRDTFERRWGDCKAKAALLIDMLTEAGIAAYPALITYAQRDRIDPEFPTPFAGFNHMIAAVPATQLATAADDPVAGGYLFVDPTAERGGIAWLPPGEQDQMALVLRGDRSELVRTPLLPALDSEQLVLDLAVRPDGSASGRLQLELRGEGGREQIERLAHNRPEAVEAAARRLIAAWFPAAAVAAPRWRAEPADEVPHATLTADITLPALVTLSVQAVPDGAAQVGAAPTAGAGSHAGSGAAGAAAPAAGAAVRWLALGGPARTPAPGLMRNRDIPVVLTPRVAETRWRLALPAGWCPDQGESTSGAEHPLGAFRQSLRCTGGILVAVRHVEIRQRWIEPQDFAALSDVALAEHRANARRLRLDRLGG